MTITCMRRWHASRYVCQKRTSVVQKAAPEAILRLDIVAFAQEPLDAVQDPGITAAVCS